MLTGRPSLRRDGAGISRRQEPRAIAQEQGSHVARHSSHSKSCGERRESVGPYLVGDRSRKHVKFCPRSPVL